MQNLQREFRVTKFKNMIKGRTFSQFGSYIKLKIEQINLKFMKVKTMSNKTNRSTASGNATNRPVAKTTSQPRDARGRFSSNSASNSSTVVKTSKTSKTAKNSNTESPAQTSSCVQSMVINDNDTVSVVMINSPKTVYTFKPTKKGLASVRSTINRGGSLGTAYNQHLRGREISKTIYK